MSWTLQGNYTAAFTLQLQLHLQAWCGTTWQTPQLDSWNEFGWVSESTKLESYQASLDQVTGTMIQADAVPQVPASYYNILQRSLRRNSLCTLHVWFNSPYFITQLSNNIVTDARGTRETICPTHDRNSTSLRTSPPNLLTFQHSGNPIFSRLHLRFLWLYNSFKR